MHCWRLRENTREVSQKTYFGLDISAKQEAWADIAALTFSKAKSKKEPEEAFKFWSKQHLGIQTRHWNKILLAAVQS